MNGRASSAVASSPVMSTTGTSWWSATSAFSALSPTGSPFRRTSQMARGL